ncbi:riboflavin biosynthesis protein RibF [bacterium]|nr:riboflavin biosynthesis protein RibF [bacterium]MBT3582097.1 riboflavin biosynthesis protein RibF [bacterium]MBT4552169.1 riboflavin biosynthesis protein RibF [bacterium]MBT5988846.1 riboflavin biosynthesis protein RibF [bacterium]MBT7087818.1 riboflavin biosynthesis protein RibF [bacterium]
MEYKITGLQNIKKIPSLGIGVFDGLHIGHQQIAKRCTHLLSFYPHPDIVLSKNKKLKMLTTLRELRFHKKNLLVVHFSKKIAKLPADLFLEKIIGALKPQKIVVGYDFKFGFKKEGDFETLQKWALKNKIQVKKIEPIKAGPEIVKSSKIRTLIEHDNLNKAITYLGHPYLIIGTVIKGDGRGSSIGFPTANILVPPKKLVPAHGVYKGKILYGNQYLKAMIYIGKRSTFNKKDWTLEVHILDYQKNIYGKQLKIFVEKKLRDDRKFNNADELIRQIKQDIRNAKFSKKTIPQLPYLQ